MGIEVSLRGKNGVIKPSVSDDNGVFIFDDCLLNPADQINVDFGGENFTAGFYEVQLDVAIPKAIIYVVQPHWTFTIPGKTTSLEVDDKLDQLIYPSAAFTGKRHIMLIRQVAAPQMLPTYRNLAVNPYDQHASGVFPHVVANVETRNEPHFFARNAIDGMIATGQHGDFPYQSWGIGSRIDAEMVINFGRAVFIDEVVVYLRADYPHDSYWNKATITFDDGLPYHLALTKTGVGQHYPMPHILTTSITLNGLVKADEEAEFAALTEIEIYGMEVK